MAFVKKEISETVQLVVILSVRVVVGWHVLSKWKPASWVKKGVERSEVKREEKKRMPDLGVESSQEEGRGGRHSYTQPPWRLVVQTSRRAARGQAFQTSWVKGPHTAPQTPHQPHPSSQSEGRSKSKFQAPWVPRPAQGTHPF